MNHPAVPDAFYWAQSSWGASLHCRALEPYASHLFTTRHLDLSDGESYQRLAEAIGAREVATLTQVHGRGVVVVRVGDHRLRTAASERPEGDAFVSNASEVAVVVRAADCVPILIADPRTGAVSAVHAGWRGTVAGAAPAAIQALAREFGARPRNMVAAIGPSIGACCYTVGSELIDAFVGNGHDRRAVERWCSSGPDGKLRLDLWAANRDQLVDAGLDEQNIHVCGMCTASNTDLFYSYRIEGAGTGRLGAAIRSR